MVAFDRLMQGVAGYIENEIISVLPGWKKWVAGGVVSLAMDKSTAVFKAVKDHPMAKAFGIVRDDGMIDIETIYKHMRASADKTGPITLEVPMVGVFKVSAQDMDRLYQMIVGG